MRLNEWYRELKAHKMGMQISCGLHPKVSEEIDLRLGTKGAGVDYTGTGSAERGFCGGGAPEVRPCAHAVVDSTEVFGFSGGRVYQGEECDSDSAEIHGSDAEFCGSEFLGSGVLCFNGWSRRGAGSGVHQGSGKRGPKARPTEYVQVKETPA